MELLDRFLDYVSYETTSNEASSSYPSSDKELVLLAHIEDQLKDLGLKTVFKNGIVYGWLKSDSAKSDTLFLMSHVDTSPEASGKDVKPQIKLFTGEPIELGNGKVLDPKVFPTLSRHKDHKLVVTSGDTLLGADDKSGCALIVDLVERLLKRGNYPNIILCFTPDEEIGRGTEGIDVELIKNGTNKIYAYTVDGGDIDVFNSENFNAASAKVTFFGTSVHPSIGKGVLINAQEVALKFHMGLPEFERPEYTDNREPFIHLVESNGGVEKAYYRYIIRNFDLRDLERQKKDFYKQEKYINDLYKKEVCKVEIKDSYFNMKEIINKDPKVVEIAKNALDKAGLSFIDVPIRGGTDGATLSYKGIPCPNLGTGGNNFHGVYEYLDIEDFYKMREVLDNIVEQLN